MNNPNFGSGEVRPLTDCIVNGAFSKELYFVKRNNCLYKIYSIKDLEIDKLYDAICCDPAFKCLTSYEQDGKNMSLENSFLEGEQHFSKTGTFEYNDGVLIDLYSTGSIDILIPNTKDCSSYKNLFSFVKKFSPDSAGKVYVFLSDGPSVFLEPLDVELTSPDILDNYNDDFAAPHKRIIEHLSTRKKGIVLLHGEPGSGKTYYLRHLTNIVKKKFIWLPADMAGGLTGAGFLKVLKNRCRNSILILEDSEKYLQKRESGLDTSMYISNILNITDGMMSDVLKIQLICTFNCDESLIDPAILRSGRLIEKYKFGKLEQSKAKKLATKLDKKIHICEDTILSDIYNAEDTSIGNQQEPQKFMGFKNV